MGKPTGCKEINGKNGADKDVNKRINNREER